MNTQLAVRHVLAAYLMVIGPVWDTLYMRRFKRSTNPNARLNLYKIGIATQWIATAAALYVVGPGIFRLHILAAHLVQLQHARIAWGFCIAVAVILPALILMPHLQALRNQKVLEKVLKRIEPMLYFLPRNSAEYGWFAALAMTAGFCEEVLYRGFLIGYFGADPWHMGFLLGALIAAVGFGLGHWYQGGSEVPSKIVGAFLFTVLFLITGSLWLPIIVHAAVDLMAIPILRRREASHEA